MIEYKVVIANNEVPIDQNDLKFLDVSSNGNSFHFLKNNSAYEVELISADYNNKIICIAVNGNSYTMKINDSYDETVERMGLLKNASQKVKDIKAPMPGLIIDVVVEEGQKIAEGTPLVILSAMKMENILLAQADGVIKSIHVKKEDTVDKGQLIMEMD